MQKAVSIRTSAPISQPRGLVLIDVQEVCNKLGFSCSDSVYKYVRERNFPKPIKGSRKNARWRLDEVDAWISALPRSIGGNPAPQKKAA